jgi:hypothetical protein
MPKKKIVKKTASSHTKYHLSTEAPVSRNKNGKMVYANKSARGKALHKKKGSWTGSVSKARKELGITGFVPINKGKEGKELYKRAKEIYGK